MNSYEAKKIPIQDFLSKIGVEPKSNRLDELWYQSPFRENDKTPSFKVNLILNTWYDFSIGKGGTIIDLSMLFYNENISETLNRLSNDYGSLPISKNRAQPSIKFSSINKPFELKHVSELKNIKLFEYLDSRKINKEIAKKYLKEIDFIIKKTGSLNFALAIKNELNGFEFRNPFMKGSVNGKSYSLINPGNEKDIAIFEGFIDFLSFLTDHNLHKFQSTVLILNSVNLRNESLSVFSKNTYQKAYCFLDNDKAGQETLDFYRQNLTIPIIDKSSIYVNYDDYNDYLKNKSA